MSCITLLHTNDLHDHRHLFERLPNVPRGENTLLVDVGDSLKGSNTLWYWKEPITQLMNQAGYQVQAMGNREFHYLRRVLQHRASVRQFPILAANLEDVRDGGTRLWERSIILQVGPYRVGFTGVTPVQYDEKSAWLTIFGFRFYQPLEVLPPILAELRKQCNAVVLLSHAGFKEDQRLAAELNDLDVILGGHSHTLLRKPHYVNRLPIVQTGCYGRFLGRTTLEMTATGTVANVDYELLPMEEETSRAIAS